MPIYEYRCTACRREFEYQHSMNDPDRLKCEACGGNTLERLISWTSVRTNNWEGALYKDNPKEAMRGLHAVDREKSHRFAGNDADATATTDASATAAASGGTSAGVGGSATAAASAPATGTIDDDDEDPAT
jgi:putative FmdB family regulatory protein